MKQLQHILQTLFPVLIFPALIFAQSSDDQQQAKQLYQEALNQSMEQRWDGAIYNFQKIIDNFPEDPHRDDAMFWVAYCTEKQGGKEHDAFELYNRLQLAYGESDWIDDALRHQVGIAGTFARQGSQKYADFLANQLNQQDSAIRYQAAIALARAGDKRALPVLEEMLDSQEFGPEAKKLLADLRGGGSASARTEQPPSSSANGPSAEDQRGLSLGNQEPGNGDNIDKTNFLNREHKLYKTMLRTDDNWSQQDLLDYGMFVLLPPKEFEEYLNSGDEKARRKWIVDEFEESDPTPGTPKNEVLEEFERRVQYAHANFFDLYPHAKSRYLQDEFQKDGWANAPWDARGDLFVKYGEPDNITLAELNPIYFEEWTYYRYNIDFIVSKYRTNIYGNAIMAGPMVRYSMRNNFDLTSFEWNYIYNKEFFYP